VEVIPFCNFYLGLFLTKKS